MSSLCKLQSFMPRQIKAFTLLASDLNSRINGTLLKKVAILYTQSEPYLDTYTIVRQFGT